MNRTVSAVAIVASLAGEGVQRMNRADLLLNDIFVGRDDRIDASDAYNQRVQLFLYLQESEIT